MSVRRAVRGTLGDLREGIAYQLILLALRIHPTAAAEMAEMVLRALPKGK